jgi:hypothetical protein
VPAHDDRGRTNDEQFEAVLPRHEWVVATGDAGTVVLADTCGYHKQLKPETGDRLLVMSQYTSGTPAYPCDLEIDGVSVNDLTVDQRCAVAAAATA